MAQTDEEIGDCLSSWIDAITDTLQRSEHLDVRTVAIAQHLLTHMSGITAVSCRLEDGESARVGTATAQGVDGAGADHLSRLAAEKGLVTAEKLRSFVGEEGCAPDGVIASISYRERSWGSLLAIWHPASSASDVAAIGSRLAALARGLALCMMSDDDRRCIERLREEQRALQDVVTIGEAMVSLLHGLNNSLNTMMLQAAVIQLKVDQSLRQEIGLIRREGATAAGRMRPLMQFREMRRQSRLLIDLHSVVREVLGDPHLSGCAARLEATRSRVIAHASDLKRLLFYLTKIAVPDAGGDAISCRLRTANLNKELLLIIEPADGGQSLSPEPGQPFDPYNDAGNADDLLERLALDSLLRLVGASLRVFPLPSGKTTTVVAWANPA